MMKIKTFQGGFDKNLSYLIWCESTRISGIVDASVELTEILECIEANNLIMEKVFVTHTHFDHIQFLDKFLNLYPKIIVYAYSKTERDLGNNYQPLEHHENISIGKELFTVLYTPGHFPDSICLWNIEEKHIYTGDTMFVGRTGRTISKQSNISDLYQSVYSILLKLPEDTIIFPGHHYGFQKQVTIIENIRNSTFFQCASEQEFIDVMDIFEKK